MHEWKPLFSQAYKGFFKKKYRFLNSVRTILIKKAIWLAMEMNTTCGQQMGLILSTE